MPFNPNIPAQGSSEPKPEEKYGFKPFKKPIDIGGGKMALGINTRELLKMRLRDTEQYRAAGVKRSELAEKIRHGEASAEEKEELAQLLKTDYIATEDQRVNEHIKKEDEAKAEELRKKIDEA